MPIFLIILVFALLLVFGIGFIADSVARANEAQAVVETAKIAQTQAVTNMVSVLVLSVLILVLTVMVIGMIVLAVRYLPKRKSEPMNEAVKPLPFFCPRIVIRNHPQLGTGNTNQLSAQNQFEEPIELDANNIDDLIEWINQL